MQLPDTRSKRHMISLTPLIDVVFILLLFFMLSTQFTRQKAMELTVPMDHGALLPDEDAPLTLLLTNTGDVKIADSDTVTLDTLATNAVIREAISRETAIRLDADDSVPLQLLVTVTDMLARAGASKVQLTALR